MHPTLKKAIRKVNLVQEQVLDVAFLYSYALMRQAEYKLHANEHYQSHEKPKLY